MASISACTPASSIARAALVQKAPAVGHSVVLGLPSMWLKKAGKVTCSMENMPRETDTTKSVAASAMIAAAAAAATWSPSALALVDERLSTEGTGLPLGLSNNLLGWIILGVFGLIWALYFGYTSNLDEDEESGLSL